MTAEAVSGTTKPAFDDLMLAMDAVDTLRHETSLADTELSSGERQAALLLRLREYYRAQGIEVSDEILENAVAEMDRNRFVHEPIPPGLVRTFALAWVRRRRYAIRTAAVAAMLAVGAYSASALHHSIVVAPAERAAAELRADLETRLPAQAREAHSRAAASAQAYGDDAARAVADNHLAATQEYIAAGDAARAKTEVGKLVALGDGLEAKIAVAGLVSKAEAARAAALAGPSDQGARTALENAAVEMTAAAGRGDARGFESAKSKLDALRSRIDTPLDIAIIDREGILSGVWRTNDNGATRVYYLVVEALDPSGRPVKMDIRNFETGRTSSVAYWAVRVPESAYRSLERDKKADGVVDQREAGRKPAGTLDIQWTVPASGGQMITSW